MTKRRQFLGWAIGIALIIALAIFAGPSTLKAMTQADPLYLCLGLLATAVVIGTATLRWRAILVSLLGRLSPPLLDQLHYVLMGATVGLFVPRDVGEMSTRIASMKLEHDQVSLGKTTLSVLVDRLFDVLILIPIFLASLPFLAGYLSEPMLLVPISILLLLGFGGLLGWKGGYHIALAAAHRFYVALFRIWGRIPLLKRIRLPQPDLLSLVPEVLPSRVMVIAFLWTTAKFLALALRAFSVSAAMHLDISFYSILLSMPLAQASLILAFTPGGLGIAEFGWYGALVLAGADPAQVAPFLLGHRMFNYAFLLFLALVGQLYYVLINAKEKRSAT